MSYKRQIDELNTYVKTKLAPSDIEGIGVVALRDIPKGQRLYTDMMPKMYNLPFKEFKNLFPEVKKEILYRFPNVVNGSAFGYPSTRIQAYMNHSDNPNYDAELDITLKDIKKGEEITEDYRKIPDAEKIYPFLIKSKKK